MEKTVLPIHFEDRSGYEFERLCFAYVLRTRDWDSIDWYGQLGSDRGRDIWGTLAYDNFNNTVCYQCANRQRLVFSKAKEDLDKVCAGPNDAPTEFILIVGGKVSANMREKVKEYAKQKGIHKTEIWDGIELEERLRKDTPSLIRRFCEGEEFPETVQELSEYAIEIGNIADTKILELYSRCFDRPAFTTPFRQESSLPHFRKAISDTIEAFNTGVYRLRDGTVIRRMPGLNDLQDAGTKAVMRKIVVRLQKLRSRFDELLRRNKIRHCGCGNPDCSTFRLTDEACFEMDQIRSEILELFRSIHPKFPVRMWRWLP